MPETSFRGIASVPPGRILAQGREPPERPGLSTAPNHSICQKQEDGGALLPLSGQRGQIPSRRHEGGDTYAGRSTARRGASGTDTSVSPGEYCTELCARGSFRVTCEA